MGINESKTFDLALTGLMTGLILVATMAVRIPMPLTQGYVHLGDSMIYLAVLFLGKRKASLAAGAGSALADLLSGYAHYVPWTLVIKGLMAFVMGTALAHPNKKMAGMRDELLEILAMILAGLVMTVGYYLAAVAMCGNWIVPLTSIPGNIAQFVVGMILADLLARTLRSLTSRPA